MPQVARLACSLAVALSLLASPVAADLATPGQAATQPAGEERTDAHDFHGVAQLYCEGNCSYAGPDGCGQADADVFCKLLTGDPRSVALSFKTRIALPQGGFACPKPTTDCHGKVCGKNLGPLPERGVHRDVHFQSTSILANHGPGNVIVHPRCTHR